MRVVREARLLSDVERAEMTSDVPLTKILTYLSVNRAFPFRYALPERAVLSSLFKKSSINSR